MSISRSILRLCSLSTVLKNVNCQRRNISSGTVFRSVFGGMQFRPIHLVPLSSSVLLGYYIYKHVPLEEYDLEKEVPIKMLKREPFWNVNREVISPTDNTGLNMTLFQYQSCPFCCKVRAYLDYYGFSYKIVEVNPVSREEISWTVYPKVPILLVESELGYQPFFDSSMIISALNSFVNAKDASIEKLAEYYPIVTKLINFKYTFTIPNKYDLYNIAESETTIEEKNWRKWIDDEFVHVLTPNVYRTLPESYRTFRWFSETGQWENYFTKFTRSLVIHSGAWVMWIVGWRQKSKYKLQSDVRLSLYESMNHFLDALEAKKQPFMGGAEPNLTDLGLYGVLKSIEGCEAFKDLRNNTNVAVWFDAVDSKVRNHAGSVLLNMNKNT